jgi:hypothetical protein
MTYRLTTGETITTRLTKNFGWAYTITLAGHVVAGDLGYMTEGDAYAAAINR